MNLNSTDELTYAVLSDDDERNRVPPCQIIISMAEARCMQTMPGGIGWENFLLIRGLSPKPVLES